MAFGKFQLCRKWRQSIQISKVSMTEVCAMRNNGLPLEPKTMYLFIPHSFIHSTATECLLGRQKIRKEQKRGCICYLLLRNKLTQM